jgi:hypothetical protein
MLFNILGAIFALSLLFLVINLFNLYIPKISNHYKQYSYKAYLIDFIHVLMILIISIILFKVFSFKGIVILIGMFILTTTIFDIALIQLLKIIKDNDFVNSIIDIAGNFAHQLILKDILVLLASFLVSMIFKLIGLNYSIVITLISVSMVVFTLL